MPTPSRPNNESVIPSQASCPPENDNVSSSWHNTRVDGETAGEESAMPEVRQQPTPPPSHSQDDAAPEIAAVNQVKHMDVDEASAVGMLSPMSVDVEKPEEHDMSHLNNKHLSSLSMGYDFSNIRLIPTSSSTFLRSGSKFHGAQHSERQVYDVQVEIKHVDMRESFLCGYLRIQGLTEDHPTLTTYFEGEIIGLKYSFLTQHQDWGSSDKVDLQHWAKFPAFQPFQKQVKKGLPTPGILQCKNIFMRWKEHFLVPDHRVRTINGASFEGFYYICFNQIQGTVSGIYFHAKSEKFQELELKHVEDRGCYAAIEFR
ncbi:vacuolar import and degradation protein-domain-containing protein [Calycina marina]|uniref:Vacuolar import and degradation protein-domain-containing protein n=1 Tax=Calycina marina TaxID=1763456 RepID=A0A9P7YZ24_9HELO|nr:vacuolar import and degradation protein-domain-containing protein [Calycina marina]